MKVLRWGVCALAALLMTAGSSFANDSEIEAMKAAMDNMKQEMDAMRATMSAEREAMRESAGGAPEALRSKGGNATVRIGGAVVTRYKAEFSSNEKVSGAQAKGGEYATALGWTIDTMKVDFDIQMSEDLSAYIDIRPDSFDKAYFQWKNIGGTGLGVQVGWVGFPGGMYSAGFNPMGKVLIYDPATKANLWSNPVGGDGISPQEDPTAMGVKAFYEMGDFKVTAGLFNNTDASGGNGGLTTNLTYAGQPGNYGISHSVLVEYTPAFIEGLGLSFCYKADVDFTERGGDDAVKYTNMRGTAYAPAFDIGAAYNTDKFSVWVNADFNLNTANYLGSAQWGLDLGANYYATDRLSFGASFSMAGADVATMEKYSIGYAAPDSADHLSIMAYRAQIGAKYVLCNGIWLRASYAHTWYTPTVDGSASGHAGNSQFTRGKDQFTFETGVSF